MEGDERIEAIAFPDRDPSFRSLVERLSEPESGKSADNFVSNEDSYPRVAADLAKRAPARSVYLGVGPDQNFTLIANARPRLAFVLDYRRRNLRLHLIHKAITTLSNDRFAYLRRLTARSPKGLEGSALSLSRELSAFRETPLDRALLEATISEVRDVLAPLRVLRDEEWSDLATIQRRLAGPGVDARFLALPMYPTLGRMIATTDRQGAPAHWLATDMTYEEVRKLHESDLIVPLVADLAGKGSLPMLAKWLKDHGLQVGVFYVSDVEFFLLRAGRLADYVANLAALPWADGGLMVRTSTREIAHRERREGDSSTTIARPAATFLTRAQAGKVKELDDLFN